VLKLKIIDRNWVKLGLGNPLKVYRLIFYQTLTTTALYENRRFCTQLSACAFEKVSQKDADIKFEISPK